MSNRVEKLADYSPWRKLVFLCTRFWRLLDMPYESIAPRHKGSGPREGVCVLWYARGPLWTTIYHLLVLNPAFALTQTVGGTLLLWPGAAERLSWLYVKMYEVFCWLDDLPEPWLTWYRYAGPRPDDVKEGADGWREVGYHWPADVDLPDPRPRCYVRETTVTEPPEDAVTWSAGTTTEIQIGDPRCDPSWCMRRAS